MNYKFLSAWALAICMYAEVKADPTPAVIEQPKAAASVLKIGYVNFAYILENLPEAKKNRAEIQSFEKQLDNQIRTKFEEFQKKTEAAQQQLDTLTDAQKKQKYVEISKLQSAIQELEEQKYLKIKQKYEAVMKPLNDRVQDVINKLAEEYAYTFVVNKHTEAGPILLFAQKSFDLSELVVEKLKVMAPKEAQPPVVGKAKAPVKAAAAKPVKKK